MFEVWRHTDHAFQCYEKTILWIMTLDIGIHEVLLLHQIEARRLNLDCKLVIVDGVCWLSSIFRLRCVASMWKDLGSQTHVVR